MVKEGNKKPLFFTLAVNGGSCIEKNVEIIMEIYYNSL